VERRTPAAFRKAVKTTTVPMVPLVRDVSRQWPPGWCTYSDGFDQNPEIEIFCGGENDKAANAAACWRQGNLLHFGFEQGPDELNEAGRQLLLNSIAYISRFTEDRPIAVTPSVFSGPVSYPRTYLDRRLGESGDTKDAEWLIHAETLAQLQKKTAAEVKRWYADTRPYLHPGPDNRLEVDQEARRLQMPIDRLEFFEKAVAALKAGGDSAATARRLLGRYGPTSESSRDSAESWEAWYNEHREYLFFSDQGDYRWYVDPLAKKRGVPSRELRGPVRASKP
jgi:hypothetical protein